MNDELAWSPGNLPTTSDAAAAASLDALFALRAAVDEREQRIEALQLCLDRKTEELKAVRASYTVLQAELQSCAPAADAPCRVVPITDAPPCLRAPQSPRARRQHARHLFAEPGG